jgi:hypothetical protein
MADPWRWAWSLTDGAGLRAQVLGVASAPSLTTLLELCLGLSCVALLATPEGLTPLGSDPRPGGAVTLSASVRRYLLSSAGDGTLSGTAWAGDRAFAVRCRWEDRRPAEGPRGPRGRSGWYPTEAVT